MRFIHLCGAACIASLLPSGASADLIFDQSVNLSHGGRISEPGEFQNADDFQLLSGASTVTDVHWWGGYFGSNTATEPDDFANLGPYFAPQTVLCEEPHVQTDEGEVNSFFTATLVTVVREPARCSQLALRVSA